MRSAVFKTTGFTCSAGISHNKMLSKLASAKNKPNRQTIVPPEGVQELLSALSVFKIRGMGGKLGKDVATKLGLVSEDSPKAVDLQRFPEEELIGRLGPKVGSWIYRVCRGIDDEEVETGTNQVKSMMAAKSFSPISDPATVESWLALLSNELAERIAGQRKRADPSAPLHEDDTITLNRTNESIDDQTIGNTSLSLLPPRVPRTLTLQFRGPSPAALRDKGKRWFNGSRSAPLVGISVCGCSTAKLAAAILAQARSLAAKVAASAMLYPCTRLALSAGDFTEAPSSSESTIARFLVKNVYTVTDESCPISSKLSGDDVKTHKTECTAFQDSYDRFDSIECDVSEHEDAAFPDGNSTPVMQANNKQVFELRPFGSAGLNEENREANDKYSSCSRRSQVQTLKDPKLNCKSMESEDGLLVKWMRSSQSRNMDLTVEDSKQPDSFEFQDSLDQLREMGVLACLEHSSRDDATVLEILRRHKGRIESALDELTNYGTRMNAQSSFEHGDRASNSEFGPKERKNDTHWKRSQAPAASKDLKRPAGQTDLWSAFGIQHSKSRTKR
mmetsp:Transcript_46605/g.123710  ORF Transcript_46605/g.123710 Transcript_46605/m.123710 type:complete len:560 (+) Transcript_46605:653-2332(+)